MSVAMREDLMQTGPLPPVLPIRFLDGRDEPPGAVDPGVLILTCANCGAPMDERKCKLICRCGYFLSCSDYY
jgi:hypothetical protein